jgi:hypothetical protein
MKILEKLTVSHLIKSSLEPPFMLSDGLMGFVLHGRGIVVRFLAEATDVSLHRSG